MPAVMVPPTAAAGSNPKDATERRAMQSGTSFVKGRHTSHGPPTPPPPCSLLTGVHL